jgi:hypothetical protein
MIRLQRKHWSPALIFTGAIVAVHEIRTNDARPSMAIGALRMKPSIERDKRKHGASPSVAKREEIRRE